MLFNEPRKDGKLPIKIRVGVARRYSYETICYVRASHWNESTRQVKSYDPNHVSLNALIKRRQGEVETLVETFEGRGWPASAQELLAIDFAEWEAGEKRAAAESRAGGGEPTGLVAYISHSVIPYWQKKGNLGNAEKYRQERDLFRAYLASLKPARQDWPMMKLDSAAVAGFFTYLRTKPKPTTKDSTLKRHLAQLEAVLAFAHRNGVIPSVPQLTVELNVKKPKKVKLQQAHIADLESFIAQPEPEQFAHGRQRQGWRTRRLALQTFICQYYLYGARVGDILLLQNKNVVSRQGVPIRIEYYQKKGRKEEGKREMSITLRPVVRDILLEYWRPQEPEGFLLPWLRDRYEYDPTKSLAENQYQESLAISSATALLNHWVKQAQQELKMELPKFTSHSARHSYAQQAKRKGKSIEWIKDTLGHSTYDITAHYLTELEAEELDKNMQDVYD